MIDDLIFAVFHDVLTVLLSFNCCRNHCHGVKLLLDTPTRRSEEVVLEPGDCIVAMDYLMERESLLLGSSAGCLLLYNVEEKTTEVLLEDWKVVSTPSPLAPMDLRLPPAIMRYTIDLRLGRYENALRNVVSAGNEYHEDCMKLLNYNPHLFPLAFQLFNEPDKRNEILEAWGDHLSEEKCFGDAALTYQCCSSYQKSLEAYRACGDWKGVFTVAGLSELEKEEITQLAHELRDEFQALGKPGDAARVALEYCSDAERGVYYYIMAREWEEALRVAYMLSKHDLVGIVRDAASECAVSWSTRKDC